MTLKLVATGIVTALGVVAAMLPTGLGALVVFDRVTGVYSYGTWGGFGAFIGLAMAFFAIVAAAMFAVTLLFLPTDYAAVSGVTHRQRVRILCRQFPVSVGIVAAGTALWLCGISVIFH